jgi:hypothetical protein
MIALAKKLFKPSKPEPDEPPWESVPAYQPPVRDTKIRMTATIRASCNGFTVEEFRKSQSYAVSAALAESLVGMGAALKV